MLVEQRVHRLELGFDFASEFFVFGFQRRLEEFEDFFGAFDVGLEVKEVGLGEDVFFAGNLGGGYFVQKIDRTGDHQLRGDVHRRDFGAQFFDVFHQLVGDFFGALGGFVFPEDALDFVETGPDGGCVFFGVGVIFGLACFFHFGGEVGETGVDARVKVAKALGDRLGALVVHTGDGVDFFCVVDVAFFQVVGEFFGVSQQ